MAARWGTGEEILSACNMEFFPSNTLDETVGLGSGESLEALHGCLDPSLLSIFEDAPTGEVKGLDEESEATLLTALTEILDNVDDENLSPFDTLPDSDLLSSQKGREHSPLRRLLCLSRSPPERDTICNARAFSTGKSLPRTNLGSIQRSDGEEEEDCSLTLSPLSQASSPDKHLVDWDDLTLPPPIVLEQEGEDADFVSMSLGDLVRHMHPYCMAVTMEDGMVDMLPEGGILLEVVDQGEYGEPILAIPGMELSLSLPTLQDCADMARLLPDESEEAFSEDSEHIIVDDYDDDDVVDVATEAPVKVVATVTPVPIPEVKAEKVIKRPKEEMMEKIPSRRKKKKKSRKEYVQAEPVHGAPPVGGRVLRSTPARKAALGVPSRKSIKEKKTKVPLVPQASTRPPSPPKHKRMNACQAETCSEVTTLTLPPEPSIKATAPVVVTSDVVKAGPERIQPGGPAQPMETPKPTAPEKHEVLSAATSAVLPAPQAPALPSGGPSSPPALLLPATAQTTVSPGSEVLPAAVAPQPAVAVPPPPPAPEPKPKSLSLAEYRRLRLQKKPAPVERQEDQSTKWPSLPELPMELPLIPCLPDPSAGDTRRPQHLSGKKEAVEVKTAWQPMGPGAPPTPEALLVPPAYMVASNSKVVSAPPKPKPKPQQTPTPQPAKPSQPPSVAAPLNPVKNASPPAQTAPLPGKPSVPLSSRSASASRHVPPAENRPSSAPSVDEARAGDGPNLAPVSIIKPVVVNQVPSKATRIALNFAALSALIPKVFPQKTTSTAQKSPQLAAVAPLSNPVKPEPSKPTVPSTPAPSSQALHPPAPSQNLKVKPAVAAVLMRPSAAPQAPRAKSATQELIEAFTSEIGIEAADLTSLLEQFEESQAKEERIVPEVCGRAAAVGNSSVEPPQERTAVERLKAHDLSSTAALTPPATPPHQMWKPLAPVALLGKSRAAEASKPLPSKVIQIDPRPLPLTKLRSKPTAAAATVAPSVACMDHDYCLPAPDAAYGEPGKRWNVKQQPSITIKTIQRPAPSTVTQLPPNAPVSYPQVATPVVVTKTQAPPLMEPLDHRTENSAGSSVLETPDASPARQESDGGAPGERSPGRGPSGSSYRRHAGSQSPPLSPKEGERKRGRSRRRASHRSSSPSSTSSESGSRSSSPQSRSRSPPKKRYRPRHSRSSSSSSSRSSSCSSSRSVSCSPPRRRRYSYSSSHSGSWSRSRSRSCSPHRRDQWGSSRRVYRTSYRHCSRETPEEVKRRKEKAIEERRVVYVGRIRGTMTRKELRERFSQYGEIEECTLHFRDHGDNYGFVTYYDTKDAFNAIENGSKLRNPDELPFDLCFGGRRQFCQTSYADLDSNNKEYEPSPVKGKFHALDFDTLLKQAQKNLKR